MNKIDSIAADIKMITGVFSREVPIDKIGSILQKADSTTLALKILSENLSLMVRQTREDFTIGMQNIREASENTNQLTKTLAENPSLLLRSETQRERNIR